MILALDAGNSRMKWAVFSLQGDLQAHGAMDHTQALPASPALLPTIWRDCSRAIVSNVAGATVAAQIEACLQQLGLSPHWLQASAVCAGVHNGYAQPAQLGSDRWAGLIAAWQLHAAPCVVAGCGTALTVDALLPAADGSSAQFLGGLILPGLQLQHGSLVQRTHAIRVLPGTLQDFPRNTGDAVYSGVLTAMAASIAAMLRQLQAQANTPVRCIITGGDATVVAEALQRHWPQAPLLDELLVLRGLSIVERHA